jgi:dUTP pyrophosphatase
MFVFLERVLSYQLSNGQLPSRGTPGSIGLDLHSTENVIILPTYNHKFKIGLKIVLPLGWYAQIAPRSGLAKNHGLLCAGDIIDQERAKEELSVHLFNHGSQHAVIRKGDRIGQLVFSEMHFIKQLVSF